MVALVATLHQNLICLVLYMLDNFLYKELIKRGVDHKKTVKKYFVKATYLYFI